MKRLSKLLSILLCMTLLICALPTYAWAATEYPAGAEPQAPIAEFAPAVDLGEEPCCNARFVYFTPEEAGDVVKQHMVNRDTTFTVHILCTPETPRDYILGMHQMYYNNALLHTGNPKEGDYLYGHIDRMSCGLSYRKDNTGYYVELTYNMTYRSTADQEAQVDAAVARLVQELDLINKVGYEKVRAIYDYITTNVTYDYANLNDSTHNIKFTAYGALIDKTCVCQGYALLFYRLALEAGLDARMITGTADNGIKTAGHAWNIVELRDVYYNVDATWDATNAQAGMPYEFFLKSDSAYREHFRDEEYKTESFYAAYPMSPVNFPNGIIAYGVCGDRMSWTLDTQYKLSIYGSGEMYDPATASVAMWQPYAPRIKQVFLEGIGTISSGAFAGCAALESIEIPASITSIGADAFSGCEKLATITFVGDAPAMENAFNGVTATATFTCSDGWRAEMLQTVGGQITWNPLGDDHVFASATCAAPKTCIYCGTTTGTTIAHAYGPWTLVAAATCTEKGVERRDCENCDHYETRELEITDHSMGQWTLVTAATCTEKGVERRDCENCDHYETRELEATGHTMGEWTLEGEVELRRCVNGGCNYVEYKHGAMNATTGVVYASVKEALDNAEPGDIISLVADSDETGKTLIVRPGVTLDLGAYELKVDYLISLTGSMIKGTRYTNKRDGAYGRLVIPQNHLVMTGATLETNGKNKVIPVWNGVDAYVLANAHINDYNSGYGLTIDEANKKLDFAFTHVMGGSANTDFLKNGADDNALKIVIRLSWATDNGVAYQDFVYNAGFVGKVASGGYNYTFSLTGYDILNIDIDTLTVTAMFLTDCGVEAAGTVWNVANAQNG